MGIGGKRALHHLLIAIAGMGAVWSFVLVAYAEWLRFGSSSSPNPATGQVIFEKSAKGAGYITTAQAFWAQQALLPIWATVLAAIFLARRVKGKAEPPGGPEAALRACAFIAAVVVMLFGDYLLAPLFEALSPYIR